MPKDLNEEQVPLGTIAFQWLIKEYNQYERTRRWYIVMGVLGAALLAYALFSGNNSFAIIIVLFGVILYLQTNQRPLEVNIAVTETGMVVGTKFYRYPEFERFWIVYNPGEIKAIYLDVKGAFRTRLAIPLEDTDPRPVRRYLSQFVLERTDGEEEPFGDKLTRLLKIQ